jgi:hypothetical protein
MKIPSKIIRNIDIPACKNCVHYRPRVFDNDFTSPFNRCDQFGVKNIVTDEITYNFADACRTDENMCGQEGRHFERQPRLWLKKIKHRMFRPFTVFVTLQVCYLVAYYIKFLL